ncbi:MAG: hypothetical protein GX162_13805 [Firmicutes bacterium]|nr:hypothetical protein [Bacillota bacterium]
MPRRVTLTLLLVLLTAMGVRAGEYYLTEDAEYWWYWDDNPNYELWVPSKAESYAPKNIFQERSLEITLKKDGPIIRVSSVANIKGGYSSIKQAVLGRWQHVLSNVKVTEEKDITTSRGVKAKFLVATGQTPEGTTAMIRLVVYLKGADAAFLELWCNQKDYTGDTYRYWIRAVNTFNWR